MKLRGASYLCHVKQIESCSFESLKNYKIINWFYKFYQNLIILIENI